MARAALGRVTAVVIVAAGPLAACGGGQQSAAPSGSVTLTLAYQSWMTPRIRKLTQQFQAQHQDIAVTLLPLSHGETAWDARANGADVREVYVAHSGRHIRLEQQNVIVDLTSFVAQDASLDLSDFYPLTLDGPLIVTFLEWYGSLFRRHRLGLAPTLPPSADGWWLPLNDAVLANG